MAAQLQPSKDMGTHLEVLFSTQIRGGQEEGRGLQAKADRRGDQGNKAVTVQ